MLGYGFWQKQFGGDRSVLGQSIALNGTQLTVVGVTPAILPSTIPGLRADFWLPSR